MRNLFILVYILIAHGFAWAQTPKDSCRKDLHGLPRELRVSPEAIEYLSKDIENADLLQSLRRVFMTLDDESAASAIGIALTDLVPATPEIENEVRANPFFAARPSLVEASAVQVYANLSRGWSSDELNTYDLGLLSFLLKDFARSLPRPRLVTLPGSVPLNFGIQGNPQIFTKIMAQTSARQTVSFLLVQAKALDHDGEMASRSRSKRDLEALKMKLTSDRKLNIDDYEIIAQNVTNLILLARFENKGVDVFVEDQGRLYFLRRQTLDLIERFLATHHQVRSKLDAIVDLLDQVFFSAPFAPSERTLIGSALDSAKRLLLPLKTEFANEARTTLAQAQPVIRVTPEFVYRPIDPFEPKGSVYIRNRETEASAPIATLDAKQDTARSLRRFSSYEQSAPLRALDAQTVYDFSFARDSVPRAQKIRFEPEVLNWFMSYKDRAQDFIDAINMGRARSFGQAGIKLVRGRSDLYSVKISTKDRLILRMQDSNWNALLVTDKDDFDRDVRALP